MPSDAGSLNTADLVRSTAIFRELSDEQMAWRQAKIEELKDKFARSGSPEEQKKIAAEIQKEAYEQVIYVPLGQYLAPSAWRKSLTGVLDGPATPIFWNIDKSE